MHKPRIEMTKLGSTTGRSAGSTIVKLSLALVPDAIEIVPIMPPGRRPFQLALPSPHASQCAHKRSAPA